jgi:hypothetical protein
MDPEASGYQRWETAEWTVDGEVVEARVVADLRDAHGAWAAFTETPEVFLVVATRVMGPADIRLERVLDSSIYGIPAGAMLDFPGSIERAIARAFGSKAGD